MKLIIWHKYNCDLKTESICAEHPAKCTASQLLASFAGISVIFGIYEESSIQLTLLCVHAHVCMCLCISDKANSFSAV